MEPQVAGVSVERRASRDRRAIRRPGERRRAQEAARLAAARLSMLEITELTADLAQELDPGLQVLGVTGAGGGCSYVEILIGDRRCAREPCRILIGVDRAVTAVDFVETLRQELRDYLARRAEPRPH